MVKQQELSRAELLAELDHRSRSRYGEPFPESLFDDLQKDDLISALDRSRNAGFRQRILRLGGTIGGRFSCSGSEPSGSKGAMRYGSNCSFVTMDSRSQMFEARYADEFLRGLRELRPQLRSQYFHRRREPGPSHLAAVERQIGAIDPRFEAAGLKQPTKFYLDKIRLGFGTASRSGLAEMEGLFLAGLDDRPLPERINDALNASDDDYVSARAALTWIERTTFRPVVGRNFIDSSNWPTQVLVIILVLQRVQRSIGGFTVSSILGRIPSRDGFERLANRLLNRQAAREGETAATNDGGNEKREK